MQDNLYLSVAIRQMVNDHRHIQEQQFQENSYLPSGIVSGVNPENGLVTVTSPTGSYQASSVTNSEQTGQSVIVMRGTNSAAISGVPSF